AGPFSELVDRGLRHLPAAAERVLFRLRRRRYVLPLEMESAQELPRRLELPRLGLERLLVGRDRLIDRSGRGVRPLGALGPPREGGVPLGDPLGLGEEGGAGEAECEKGKGTWESETSNLHGRDSAMEATDRSLSVDDGDRSLRRGACEKEDVIDSRLRGRLNR